MTLQQTVNITEDRKIHFDLPVPKSIPIGKAEVKIVFMSHTVAPKSKKQSAFACLNEYADASKIELEKGAWEIEAIKKYAGN